MSGFPFGITVTVERDQPGGYDAYGSPVDDGYPTVTFTIDGCGIAPRLSNDVTDPGRHGLVVGLTLYAPADADLEPTDRIVVGVDTYEIEGDLARWSSPLTGWQPGIVANLTKATG